MKRPWSIRTYEKGDEDELFELTKAVWGRRVPEKKIWLKGWQWMHFDNPAGASKIWLVEIDDKLVGQDSFILLEMKIGGKIIKGTVNLDLMIHPEYQRRGIANSLEKKALGELENENIHLVYGFPNQQIYPLHIKCGWLDICTFQVMIKPLNLKKIMQNHFAQNKLKATIFTACANPIIKTFFRSKKVINEGQLEIREITKFDDRINKFWNRVSDTYTIITIRDKKYLNWRYVDRPTLDYNIYAAKEADEIYGYIVLGYRNENNLLYGIIEDLIALTDNVDIIQGLIAKAVEYFNAKGVDAILCRMITNEVYRKAFMGNGFIPHFRYKGRFIAYNNSTLLSEMVLKRPDNWFIQSGDSPSIY